MVKQKFYFDTSVFGGVFDEGFAEASAMLFERVKLGLITCLYSEVTLKELALAPEKVRLFFEEVRSYDVQLLTITPEIQTLAKLYVDEKVVGKTSFDDCLHIAFATHYRADVLASWNFKHIVNVYRIRGYNAINLRLGYPQLEIRSPKDLVYGTHNY